MSTAIVSTFTCGYEVGWCYSSCISCLWVDCIFIKSRYLSLMSLFTRAFMDLLNVVYSAGAWVVLKGKRMHRSAIFSIIEMHVDSVYASVCIWWYVTSGSVFLVRMCFNVHLRCITAILWSILRSKRPYKHCCGVPYRTRLFTDRPDGPVKGRTWVMRLLVQCSPFSFTDDLFSNPSGTTPAFLMCSNESMVMGRNQPCSTSFCIAFSKAGALRFDLDYLLFPLNIIVYRSDLLVTSSIGNMWYWEPLWTMSIILPLFSL